MKAKILSSLMAAGASLLPVSHGATLIDTFETGEDTSNWNSTWTDGTTTTGFLDPGFGGEAAGIGGSNVQTFSRSFKDNTAGVSVTTAYSVSMYVQVNAFGTPSDGRFEIVDGSYGSENTANFGIRTETVGEGTYIYHWQTRSTSGWEDLGLNLELGTPYRVQFDVDPTTNTYDAYVQQVDSSGTVNVLNTAQRDDIAFGGNVINNHNNGNLLFYIQASSGTTTAMVDNINIQAVPELSTAALMIPATLPWLVRRKRSRVDSAT